jgi:ubiquinone/menaquinone biosynthesis C-methylase UbiE
MCHLSKTDTARAVKEMRRVLKPGGLGFLGVISTDTWPKSILGEEEGPGEYRGPEGERDRVLHSLFTDREADQLVKDWETLWKSKQISYLHQAADELTRDEWQELFSESGGGLTESEWEKLYGSRRDCFQYVHLYFCLRKPEN